MADFAGFDEEMHVSLENTFFPKIQGNQSGDFEYNQHEQISQDSDSEDEIIFQITKPSIDTHELANEFFVAELHGEEHTEINETEACVFSQTDPDAILLDEKLRSGCPCKSKNCYKAFDSDVIIDHRLTMREYEKHEKESYLIGKLDQCCSKSTNRCKNSVRERQKFKYSFLDMFICEDAFMFIHDIGNKAFKNLKQHYKIKGIEPRSHGLKRRRPPNATSFNDIENVVKFIKKFGEDNGLPMPAAPRGRNDIPPIFLPAYETKVHIHSVYKESCIASEKRPVGLTLFKNIWSHTLSHIKIIKPRSDLCFACQKHRDSVSSAVTEEEKLRATGAYMDHIRKAQRERDFYNECMRKCKESVTASNIMPGTNQPNSTDLSDIHYLFDFSQVFAIPHLSQQVGPLYFVTPKKLQCFGICNSGIPLQTNFLIGEDGTIGVDGTRCHGPNSVLSMLHAYLSCKSYGEKEVNFHCDNCVGQNKNKSMLHYLSWRCARGLNTSIKIHFMIAGHTKSLCDGCFGLIRIKYIRSDCHSYQQLNNLVNSSAVCNEVFDTPFNWFDWDSYFSRSLIGLKGISKYQHFRLTSEFGIVYAKQSLESDEIRIDLKKRGANITDIIDNMPPMLYPGGLSLERKKYLFNNVRKFISPHYQDQECPPFQ